MKIWLSAEEIANLALPGLPTSKRRVNALATKEGWIDSPHARRRSGRAGGGGYEYALDLLPETARAAYVARHLEAINVPATIRDAAEAEPQAASLNDRAAENRDARLALLNLADRYAADTKLARKKADNAFSDLYNGKQFTVAPWIRDAVPSITRRTLARWRAATLKGQANSLAVDPGKSRRGTGVLDAANNGEVKLYALALVAKQPHLTSHHVRALLLDRFAELTLPDGRRVPMPPIRTVQRVLSKWKDDNKVVLTAITNPDAFKSRYRTSGSNTASLVTRLNELWEIDASPADVLCVDGRYSVYVAIDVFSRRLKFYVSRTARAEAVGLLMRRAILSWGVPERVKTDNGSDFTAKSTQRLLAALFIEHELAPPFSPEKKPHVERAIGTFQRDLGPLLPGFIGHSVADRKAIEARKSFASRLGEDPSDAFCVELSANELQNYCDQWANERYAQSPHAGIGGATPFQVAAAYNGPLRRVPDERALDILLAPVAGRDGRRIVGKQGIRLDGSVYLCPTVLPDTDVMVRQDPADLGRVFLFSPDGGLFLGFGECPELLGIDPVAAAAATKAAHKKILAEGTKQIRAQIRKIKPRDMADTILRQAALESGKLAEFPKRIEDHVTPAMTAALDVFEPMNTRSAPLSEQDAQLLASIEAELAPEPMSAPATNVHTLRTFETPQQRFRRALSLQEALKRGETVSSEQIRWLGGYEASAEYLGLAQVYADFGEEALR